MAQTTIEWTRADSETPGYSFNPWIGCARVSEACDNCYAAAWADRFGKPHLWAGSLEKTSGRNSEGPIRWDDSARRRQARWLFGDQSGPRPARPRVFCASMADWADNRAPEAWRHALWSLIRATPNLDWLMLTKRPTNIQRYLPSDWDGGYPNVWLGITAENQARYSQGWPILSTIPAVIRFVSYGPALGPLVLGRDAARMPDWVVAEGESSREARITQPRWIRSVRDECRANGIPFLLKQWGEWRPPVELVPGDADLPATAFARVGKKNAGRDLDGVVHNESPDSRNWTVPI